ncbi:MAG: hypothetical protein ACE5D0_07690 [Fidelibacterota bacterium]
MRFIFKFFSIFLPWLVWATGTQFLTIPTSGSELAIGTSAIHNNNINPASISANASGLFLNISHGSWVADSKTSSLLMLFPGDRAHMGANLRYFEIDDLELRNETPTDEPLAFYGANGFAMGVSGSWESYGMKMGTAIRLIRMDLYTENSQGFSTDFGLIKQLTSKIKVGASVLNLGKMSALKLDVPELPKRVIASAGYLSTVPTFSNEFTLGVENSSLVDGIIFHGSNETKWRNIILRQSSKISKEVSEISFGVGFRFGIYNLNYGILIGSQDLGTPQMLDLTIYFP